MDSFRQVGDADADEVINTLMAQEAKAELYKIFTAKSFNDIHQLSIKDQVLLDFVMEGNQLPAWADAEKMAIASDLFRNNGNEFLFMLGIVSLPYCYAAAKGAMSLYHTEKIRKNTEARLLDTTSFIVDIMRPNAFSSNGNGFLVVKQVRLRHALARYFLKDVPQVQRLQETPINQEDMAGTNLAFSYIALRTLPKIGVKIPNETQNAYIHFWSVIGLLLGLDKQLLPMDLKEAFWLEKKIAERQFRPSTEGKELMKHLLDHYKSAIPNKGTVALIKPMMRYLNGSEISSLIGLERDFKLFDASYLMILLPLFKRFVFPPVQSFDTIIKQIKTRQRELYSRKHHSVTHSG